MRRASPSRQPDSRRGADTRRPSARPAHTAISAAGFHLFAYPFAGETRRTSSLYVTLALSLSRHQPASAEAPRDSATRRPPNIAAARTLDGWCAAVSSRRSSSSPLENSPTSTFSIDTVTVKPITSSPELTGVKYTPNASANRIMAIDHAVQSPPPTGVGRQTSAPAAPADMTYTLVDRAPVSCATPSPGRRPGARSAIWWAGNFARRNL